MSEVASSAGRAWANGLAKRWGRAWFSADPRALGLFRIAFGLLCLWDVLRRWRWIETFYANSGVLSNHFSLFRPHATYTFSLLYPFGRPEEVAVFFGFTVVCLLAFTLGWFTKAAHVLSLLCIISIHSRNILLENGGDVVMNLWWVWTLFLPLGRRFSIDALRVSWRRKEGPAGLNARAPPARAPVWSLAVFAVLLQLAAIYFLNTVHKSGRTWMDGTALAWTLEQDRIVTWIGLWVRDVWPQGILKAMTWGTLAIEGAAPVLLLSPIATTWTRRVAFVSLAGLHLGIFMMTDVGLFSPTMVVAYLLLLTPPDIELGKRWLRRLAGAPITLAYDSDCGVCHACARLLARLDVLGQVTLVARDPDSALPPGYDRARFDAEREDTIIAWTDDRVWTRHRALARAVAALPLGRLVAWVAVLPGVSWLLERGYRAFAARRYAVGAALGFGVCGVPQLGDGAGEDEAPVRRWGRWARWGAAQAVVAVIMAACISQALIENRYIKRTLGVKHAQPSWARQVVQYGRLFQGWSMFAPNAPTGDGWMVIDVELEDGTHVDPQTGEAPVMRPVEAALMPEGQFWGSYTSRLAAGRNRRYRDGLVHYLRNKDIDRLELPAGVEVRSIVAWWVADASPTPGSGAEPRMEEPKEVIRWPRGARRD